MERSFAAVATVLGMLCSGPAAGAQSPEVISAQRATAQTPPTLIRIDGQVKTLKGAIRNDTVLLVVALYESQDAPGPLWLEEQAVTLDANGRYSVFAGATLSEGVPKELFASGAARWIGVAVQGEAEQPRIMLLSVPYALKARDADTLAGKTTADFVLTENLTDSVKSTLKAEGITSKEAAPGIQASTAGRIAKFSDTVNTTVDSIITESGGNIGIGTTGPTYLLDVNTGINVNKNGTVTSGFVNGVALGGWDGWGYPSTGNNMVIGGYRAAQWDAIRFYTSGTEKVRVDTMGNVGLGTTSPGARLDVSTGIRVNSSGTVVSGFVDGVNIGTWDALGYPSTGSNMAIGGYRSSQWDAIRFYTSGTEKVRIDTSGNVGIGTASPSTKLHVVGDVTVTGNIGAKYQDVAEWVETPEPLEAGTVVIVDPLEPNRVLAAPRAYDTRVAGAVSRQPGLVLGERSDTKAMIAQSGRVRVKVDASYGAIRIGDLLVTSPTPGYAMRSRPIKVGGQSLHRPGTLLGKALEALPNGKGEILVLLTLQ